MRKTDRQTNAAENLIPAITFGVGNYKSSISTACKTSGSQSLMWAYTSRITVCHCLARKHCHFQHL